MNGIRTLIQVQYGQKDIIHILMRVWHICINIVNDTNYSIYSCVLSKEGNRLITVCQDSTVRMYDIHGSLLHQFHSPRFVITADLSPTGDSLVTSSTDSIIRIWDTNNDKH